MEGSKIVTADAQFGIAHILRPYTDFESVYEGQSAETPVMFTELGLETDELAGTAGYSARLMRGLPVSFGARIILAIPGISSLGGEFYRWTVVWRWRSVADHRRARGPYHYPKQGDGVPETPGPVARVIRPAIYESVVFNQAEPAGGNLTVAHVRREDIDIRLDTNPLPLLSDGATGYYQQGILDPGVYALAAPNPFFLSVDLTAKGDEMLIGAYRSVDNVATWTFATEDENFSNAFGNGTGTEYPDIGVLVLQGSAP